LTADTHPRKGARDLLVLALYQEQLSGHDMAELVAQFEAREEFATIDQVYFLDLLRRVLDNVEALDAIVAELAVRSLQQLDAVGLAILRLAVAELKYRFDVPRKVIINEAVDLAKRYGANDSYRFVNAVLDKAAKQVEGRKQSAAG
jgi:N utilization substance protein B